MRRVWTRRNRVKGELRRGALKTQRGDRAGARVSLKVGAAVYRLATVGSYTLPCDRLDVLLAAAREVPVVFAAEHKGEEVLGGDDFLPIFVYVVVQAGIPDLRYLQTVLSALCDPDKRLSETGYYVATFEAAVEHIRELPLARVLRRKPFCGVSVVLYKTLYTAYDDASTGGPRCGLSTSFPSTSSTRASYTSVTSSTRFATATSASARPRSAAASFALPTTPAAFKSCDSQPHFVVKPGACIRSCVRVAGGMRAALLSKSRAAFKSTRSGFK